MLRLMSYNIHFGGVGREERIAEVIKHVDPDIVMLQEATRTDVVERLSTADGICRHARVAAKLLRALLSRVESSQYEWHCRREMQRPFMEIKLAEPDMTHLWCSSESNAFESNRATANAGGPRASRKSSKNIASGFHLLMGDFNTLAPGELLNMQKLPMRYRMLAMVLGGRVTYRTIQIMLDAGYTSTLIDGCTPIMGTRFRRGTRT